MVSTMLRSGKQTISTLLGVPACLLAAAGVCLAAFFYLPRGIARGLLHEGGMVEAATVAFYIAAAAAAGWQAARLRWTDGTLIGILLASFAMRELDFHTRFTSMGVLKSRYYLDSTIPAIQKVFAALVLLGLLTLAVSVFVRNRRSFMRAIRSGYAPAWAVAVGVLCLPASKAIDRAPALIRDHAPAPLLADTRFAFLVIEECMELAIPILFLWALLVHRYAPPPHGVKGLAGSAWPMGDRPGDALVRDSG